MVPKTVQIVTTWIDGNSQHVYFDDLTYTVSPQRR